MSAAMGLKVEPFASPSSSSGISRKPIRILSIVTDPGVQDYVGDVLSKKYLLTPCSSIAQALQKLTAGANPDFVLLDTMHAECDGLAELIHSKVLRPNVPVVLLSCSSGPEELMRALRLGAAEILQKPFDSTMLIDSVQRHVGDGKNNASTQGHEIVLDENISFVHCDERMKLIRDQSAVVARVDLPVLILGESGTGKEILAHYIHKMSPRSRNTFMKVNCAAMPADLLESELFGYEQGAFTGAVKAKPGKFELCNGGTILLDEIGEMPPSLQAKLLHILQDGTFSRLGGRTTLKADVRVIAATNIDIKAAIADKTFREDLYYRLNGFSMHLPPLRERKTEIPILFAYFMRKLSEKYGQPRVTPTSELTTAMMNYKWPGNLRELENFVKRFIVLSDERYMIDELMQSTTRTSFGTDNPHRSTDGLKGMVRSMKDDAEAIAIAQALESTRWNRKQAATHLKISYKALLYKIKQYNLQPPKAFASNAQ